MSYKKDIDPIMMRDIALTVENNYGFYSSRIVPWANNAARRMKKGTFDKKKFMGGLERNLSKDAQVAYYRLNRMGPAPRLNAAQKKIIAKELAPGILNLAKDFK